LDIVRQMTKRDDLVFRMVEFDDDIQPNAALVSDDLDANRYQDRCLAISPAIRRS
jgi:ABC-type metal ion transport system substrate-binding protein